MKLGLIAVFSFLALLTGCTKPCVLPGEHSEDPAVSCYYQIKITNIDMANWRVKGELPDVLKEKGAEKITAAKEEKHYSNEGEFIFRVRDLDKVAAEMQVGKMHEFIRQGNSPYLELLP